MDFKKTYFEKIIVFYFDKKNKLFHLSKYIFYYNIFFNLIYIFFKGSSKNYSQSSFFQFYYKINIKNWKNMIHTAKLYHLFLI